MAASFQVNTASGGSLTTGLVSYWNMDEASGNRADFYGSNTLTDNNTVTTDTAKLGANAAKFTTANSEYFNTGNVMDNPSAWSISFWIKAASAATDRGIQNKIAGNADGPGYLTRLRSDHKIGFSVQDAGSVNYKQTRGTTTVDDGNWHFVVISFNQSEFTAGTDAGIYVYVDGGADEATDDGCSGTTGSLSNALNFEIGRWGQTSNINYFNDTLDEIGVWTKVLNADERTDLYNGGSGNPMVSSGGAANHWLMMGI